MVLGYLLGAKDAVEFVECVFLADLCGHEWFVPLLDEAACAGAHDNIGTRDGTHDLTEGVE